MEKDLKCTYVGCKNPVKHTVLQTWNKNLMHVCEKHTMEWIKKGLKESPPPPVLNVNVSFYKLLLTYE